MKFSIILIIGLLGSLEMGTSRAVPPQPLVTQTTANEQVIVRLSEKNMGPGIGPANNQPGVLQPGSSPFPFWEIKDPMVTSTHYAVVGEIRYDDVSNGYLEMSSAFAPVDPGGLAAWYSTCTRAEQGAGSLQGTSDWKPFWLPFDSSRIKTRLTRIGVRLRLADRGNVYLRNVRLVQYPDGTFPSSLAPSGTIPPPQLPSGELAFQEQSPPASAPAPAKEITITKLDWKSFWLGAAAALLFTMGTGLLALAFSRSLNRLRHQRELRRIASLDS